MKSDRNGASWPSRLLRFVLWGVLLVTAGYALMVALGMYLGAGAREVRHSGEADIRSAFALTDHTGRTVTEADYADRWQLAFFGFTHCPDVCPTTLAYMASVLDRLGDHADEVVPLFITVDPTRDTVPVMAEYVSVFHPRLVGLTGTEAQVAAAARNFRTWYERSEDPSAPDGYVMAHAGHVYLMRPGGAFEGVYQESDQTPEALAGEIADKIQNGSR